MHDFDSVDVGGLVGRHTLKWGRHGAGVLGAWVAEMDYAPAPPLRAALHDAVDRGVTGYPLRDIRTGLPAACAAWLETTSGWRVPPERIFLIPDVLTGIGLGITAYSRPGSAVVVPTPAYPPFLEVVRARRRELVEVPLSRTALDLPAIDRALGRGAGTVLLCSPHNPTGHVYSRAELAALGEVVAAHGARVIADEVHAALVYPGREHVPYAAVSATTAAHSLTLTSASKGWNIAGLKCAQVVLTGPGDVERWRSLPFHDRHGASTLGIVANFAAYTEGGPWLRDVVAYLDANRRFAHEFLSDRLPELGWTPPDATYLAWLDCGSYGFADPAAEFLRHGRVALSDGRAFGAAGAGFVRLNFATSRRVLEAILTAMAGTVRERAASRPRAVAQPPAG